MDFSQEDVRRLFGEWWYIVPEKPTVIEELKTVSSSGQGEAGEPQGLDEAIFTVGESVVWKMKAESKLALVLVEEEFTNKNLTASLKSYVIQAGLSLAEVGFGVVQQAATQFDLTTVPVNQVVFLGIFTQEDIPSSYTWKDKDFFFVPLLVDILTGEDIQEETVALLKQAQFLLHP
ncbi:MAG: hypothetical protein AAF655_05660 [Bacteroidota bacterium]